MLNKANRDKLRKLHAEFNDDNALLWYSACSDNMMPALDALDALEQERDALAAQGPRTAALRPGPVLHPVAG